RRWPAACGTRPDAVTWQLREYTVKPGEMAQWLEEWRSQIVPPRLKHGVRILGSWTVDGTDQVVCIITYDGPRSWAEADRDHHQPPDPKANAPAPAKPH